MTEDHVMSHDCLPHVPSADDTSKCNDAKTETLSVTKSESDVPCNPLVKVEDLLNHSNESAGTREYGKSTKLETTSKNVKVDLSTLNALPKDSVKTEHSKHDRNGVKSEENLTEVCASESERKKQSSCKGGDQTTEINSGESDCPDVTESHHKSGLGDGRQDTFTCTRCNMTFPEKVSMQSHSCRIPHDEFQRSSKEPTGLVFHHQDGSDNKGGNSCDATRDTGIGENPAVDSLGSEAVNKSDNVGCKCSPCHETLAAIKSLRNGLQIHTGVDPFKNPFQEQSRCASDENSKLKKPRKKKKCKICGKMFCKNMELKKHMKKHEDTFKEHEETKLPGKEKPFKCILCGKAFCESYSMEQNMATLN